MRVFLFLAFTILFSSRVFGASDCYTKFYQNKDMKCVDQLAEKIIANPSKSDDSDLVGFFAGLIQTYPEKKSGLLVKATSIRSQRIFSEALYFAGLKDEASDYADKLGHPEFVVGLKSLEISPLESLYPKLGSDSDLLMGAFLATGKAEYVQRILNGFKDVDDDQAYAAIRTGLVSTKFGLGQGAPNRGDNMKVGLCRKFGCKTNPQLFHQFLIFAAGYWETQSYSTDDENLTNIISDFFNSDGRLKKINTVEQDAYIDYLSKLKVFETQKDDKKLETSLRAYENYEPVVKATALSSADCYTKFYQSKDMTCVDGLVAIKSADRSLADGKKLPFGIVGFFAGLFENYPDKKDKLLAKANSPGIQNIYSKALYMAGLGDEAKTTARKFGHPEFVAEMAGSQFPTLPSFYPKDNPADNDLLIGAFMATGKVEYIQRILDNLKAADNDQVHTAIRSGLVRGRFGPGLGAPNRGNNMAAALCEKYGCKTDRQLLLHSLTLSSGFWATQSEGEKDEIIDKTVKDFFKSDERLGKIFEEEQGAFSDYFMKVKVFDRMNGNEQIDASLHSYENFAPASETTALKLKVAN